MIYLNYRAGRGPGLVIGNGVGRGFPGNGRIGLFGACGLFR